MTLILSNEDVEQILAMKDCVEVVEDAFIELGHGRAINTIREDVLLPCSFNPEATYYPKSFQGGVPKLGVYAVRINSDLLTYPKVEGQERMVRIPIPQHPGKFCALVLLFSTDTCEPLAIVHSGFMQRMRVGATGGIGAKYLAREDAQTVGLIGSSWQAGAQLMALCEVRKITAIKVYSTNQQRREQFAKTMAETLGVEVKAVDSARECVEGVDIVDLATSSREPVISGSWLEKGMHVHSIQPLEIGSDTYERADVVVTNSRPWGKGDETYPYIATYIMKGLSRERANFPSVTHLPLRWEDLPGLPEVMLGAVPGRTNGEQITLHLNNVGLGIQFAAVGAKIYELARGKGVGKEIPTEWLLQTVQG